MKKRCSRMETVYRFSGYSIPQNMAAYKGEKRQNCVFLWTVCKRRRIGERCTLLLLTPYIFKPQGYAVFQDSPVFPIGQPTVQRRLLDVGSGRILPH